jgi:hypothetical protein
MGKADRNKLNKLIAERFPDQLKSQGIDPDDLKKDKRPSNKFNAQKTVIDGITFDSKKEGYRYQVLKTLKKDPTNPVVSIKRQVPFIAKVVSPSGEEIEVWKYKLDFLVTYKDGRVDHEDVKGHKKGSAYEVFRLKKKHIEAQYGIRIIEI